MAGRGARFELLTPRGPGGVAVVAVRGPDRWQQVAPLLGGAPPPAGGTPRLAALVLGSTQVDEVLVVDRPGPEVLELHLHGSPAVLRELERAVGGLAAAAPQRGDDLLCQAQSPEQLALALEQRGLLFVDWLAGADRAELAAGLERSRVVQAHRWPRRVVLCGDQNAGKSTLMNRLLFRERVMTGDLPGLTRDPVRESTLLDGYPYELVDTAGEGGVEDDIDRRALDLARGARRQALLLLVVDGSRQPSASDRAIRDERTLVVRSKADLPAAPWPADFSADVTVSCRDAAAAGRVRAVVGAALRGRRQLPPAGPLGAPAALSAAELAALQQRYRSLGGATPPKNRLRNPGGQRLE